MTAMASTGCVDRLIRDFDDVAGGGASMGGSATESDGIGDTEQVDPSTSDTTAGLDPELECSLPEHCDAGQTCFEGVCVGTGTLRISLSWNVVTDLDLHLFVPNGDVINFQNDVESYGELDVDDCIQGDCRNEGTHVENIFLESSAPRGTYGIQVINYDGRATASYTVEVAGAVDAAFSGTIAATPFAEGAVHSITW